MSSINLESILGKARKYMDSPRGKHRLDTELDIAAVSGEKRSGSGGGRSIHTVQEAGEKFGQVLRDTIQSSLMPPGVIRALEDYDVSPPVKIKPGRYQIRVYFDNPTERLSMSSYKGYYPIDLAELYNNGVDHLMAQLFEHDMIGRLHASSSFIPGAHFMEEAIADFMGNYAAEYNVSRITVTGSDIDSQRGVEYRRYMKSEWGIG